MKCKVMFYSWSRNFKIWAWSLIFIEVRNRTRDICDYFCHIKFGSFIDIGIKYILSKTLTWKRHKTSEIHSFPINDIHKRTKYCWIVFTIRTHKISSDYPSTHTEQHTLQISSPFKKLHKWKQIIWVHESWVEKEYSRIIYIWDLEIII